MIIHMYILGALYILSHLILSITLSDSTVTHFEGTKKMRLGDFALLTELANNGVEIQT